MTDEDKKIVADYMGGYFPNMAAIITTFQRMEKLFTSTSTMLDCVFRKCRSGESGISFYIGLTTTVSHIESGKILLLIFITPIISSRLSANGGRGNESILCSS